MLVMVWAACLGLIRRGSSFSRPAVVLAGGLGLFSCWVGASAIWSDDRSATLLDLQRDVVYLVGVLAVLILVDRRSFTSFIACLLAAVAVVDIYALSTRLLPGKSLRLPLELNQLSEPVGYANGLALLTVLGLLVGFGLATSTAHGWLRAAAGATLPALGATLFFTFSRGGWLALIAGGAAVLLAARDRRRVLLSSVPVLPWVVGAIWLSSRQRALDTLVSNASRTAHQGHLLAIVLLGLCAASALGGFASPRLAGRSIGGSLRPAQFAVLASAVCTLLLAGTVVRYGAPTNWVRAAWTSFTKPPSAEPTQVHLRNDLSNRLFDVNGTYRAQQWRVAWDEYADHPWLGSGGGTYGRFWLEHRPSDLTVHDAHNLYLQTFAELGVVGLVLLLASLLAPVAAALSIERGGLIPFVLGAYVAFLGHAAVDWDWQQPAVSLAGLACGAALVCLARPRVGWTLGRVGRPLAAIGLIGAAAGSAWTLAGNRDLAHATTEVSSAQWSAAATDARASTRWLPWSGTAWQMLGDAQLGLGETEAARTSLEHATRKSPNDWSIWFDLGTATSGRERRAAYARAARLNPLDPNVVALTGHDG